MKLRAFLVLSVLLASSALPALAVKTRSTPAACAPTPRPTSREQTISGTITTLNGEDGRFGFIVRTSSGVMTEVDSSPSTLIKPAGTRLEWGMQVRVVGYMLGCVFIAREITVTAYA